MLANLCWGAPPEPPQRPSTAARVLASYRAADAAAASSLGLPTPAPRPPLTRPLSAAASIAAAVARVAGMRSGGICGASIEGRQQQRQRQRRPRCLPFDVLVAVLLFLPERTRLRLAPRVCAAWRAAAFADAAWPRPPDAVHQVRSTHRVLEHDGRHEATTTATTTTTAVLAISDHGQHTAAEDAPRRPASGVAGSRAAAVAALRSERAAWDAAEAALKARCAAAVARATRPLASSNNNGNDVNDDAAAVVGSSNAIASNAAFDGLRDECAVALRAVDQLVRAWATARAVATGAPSIDATDTDQSDDSADVTALRVALQREAAIARFARRLATGGCRSAAAATVAVVSSPPWDPALGAGFGTCGCGNRLRPRTLGQLELACGAGASGVGASCCDEMTAMRSELRRRCKRTQPVDL